MRLRLAVLRAAAESSGRGREHKARALPRVRPRKPLHPFSIHQDLTGMDRCGPTPSPSSASQTGVGEGVTAPALNPNLQRVFENPNTTFFLNLIDEIFTHVNTNVPVCVDNRGLGCREGLRAHGMKTNSFCCKKKKKEHPCIEIFKHYGKCILRKN